MRNLVQALKSEITRLAKKEVKAQTAALRAASSKYRHEISDLKRVTKDLERRLALMDRQERKRAEKPPPVDLAEGRRFSAKGLRSHRARLGLSAEDYGLLAGVSGQMIHKYEQGRTKPRRAQVAKLVTMRGVGKREARLRLQQLQE